MLRRTSCKVLSCNFLCILGLGKVRCGSVPVMPSSVPFSGLGFHVTTEAVYCNCVKDAEDKKIVIDINCS